MSNHSVIAHRANYHYFKLEEDYVLICSSGEQYPQCKAAILAILEHWINDKKAKGQELYVYMTYPEWIDALYGLFRRNHIMACLNELVGEGLIVRRPCRRAGKDSYEYTLNVGVIQEKLKQLAERVDKNTRPNLNASKFKRVQKPTHPNLDGTTSPNLNASEHEHPSKSKRNVYSITEIPSNIDSERAVTDARALEHEHENYSYSGHDTTLKHKTWQCEAWCNAHRGTCAEYQQYIDSKAREETPTEPRVEAVKIGASNGTRDTDPANRHPVTDRLVNLADQDTTVAQGATDGRLPHPTMHRDPHSPHDPHREHTDTEVHSSAPLAIASTPGRAASPPAAAHDPHSLQGPQDGATTALEAGESRASGKRNVHLSAHEAEMRAWLEELRGTELDLARRDITAIRSLGKKKGSDDKEMFLNVVAVLDIDPWFEEHSVAVDFYWIDYWWQNKYMFLQRKKPKAALDDGERHSDFDIYKGNGPEARKKWREEGARLKALGYSPDL